MEIDENKLIEGLKKALTYDGPDRPALIARIPVICNDIRWIKQMLYAVLFGIGYLALKQLGVIP